MIDIEREQSLDKIQRVIARLEALARKGSRKAVDQILAGKLFHARTIERLLRAELGIGPPPTGARRMEVGGVSLTFPTWEVA